VKGISARAKLAGSIIGLILLAVILGGAVRMWSGESAPARDPVEHVTAGCDELRNTYSHEVATGLGC
jgi:hypothetical protein